MSNIDPRESFNRLLKAVNLKYYIGMGHVQAIRDACDAQSTLLEKAKSHVVTRKSTYKKPEASKSTFKDKGE